MRVALDGYNGLYEIDESGNIWNKDGQAMKWNVSKHTHGYGRVRLYKNGKEKTHRVHRLVALMFIPNPENHEQVNHIDENKLNNNISNLEWTSNRDNSTAFYKNNPHIIKCGSANKKIKINGIEYPSIHSASDFISTDSGRGKPDTIRREIRRRHLQSGDCWLMYGKYHIGA